MVCVAYTSGVADTFELTRIGAKLPYCIPKTASAEQVTSAVKAYLASHPDELHLSAALLVIKAINETYGCQSR